MKKNQKLIVYGAAGLLAAYLLYRWWSNRNASAATGTPTTTPTDQAASDYASLAGQQQAGEAALQAQEQQDVANLGAQLGTIQSSLSAAPSQSDLANLQAFEQQQLADALAGLVPAGVAPAPGAAFVDPTTSVAEAAGAVPANRAPVRPAGAPKNAIWSGPLKPPGNFKGIGGGWWAPVKAAIHPPNPHSSVHQPGNPGHNGTAPAGHAVAPSTHAPKPPTVRKPQPPHPSGTQQHPSGIASTGAAILSRPAPRPPAPHAGGQGKPPKKPKR